MDGTLKITSCDLTYTSIKMAKQNRLAHHSRWNSSTVSLNVPGIHIASVSLYPDSFSWTPSRSRQHLPLCVKRATCPSSDGCMESKKYFLWLYRCYGYDSQSWLVYGIVLPTLYCTWLVVEPAPLKNMSSSGGMMTFPIYGKNKSHVPNHQPDNHSSLPLEITS